MAKGSPKGSKGSPDKKSKSSKKKSPDKSKSKGKTPPKTEEPPPPELPCRAMELHPNVPVRNTQLHWRDGPGFTVLVNICYTKEQATLFRDFFNLPLWDLLAPEASPDNHCRECIHGFCKDGFKQASKLPLIEESICKNLPCWDLVYAPQRDPRECCPHRGGTNLATVNIAAIPYGPIYVNTHNIKAREPTIIKSRPPKSLSVAYTYMRNLGLKVLYDMAVHKEIQGIYMEVKAVQAVNATIIRRAYDTTKLGLVLSVMSGPCVFVLFVIKESPAYHANIHYGDQILEVDGLPLNNRLALNRLTEAKSLVIKVLYTQCPFKKYYQFEILKGDTMGFQIVDGNIIYVKVDTPAYKARLPINHQIIELEHECIAGLSNLELQREIRNRASVRSNRVVQMTVIPRYIYNGLIGSMDPKYIRRRALVVIANMS